MRKRPLVRRDWLDKVMESQDDPRTVQLGLNMFV
jgi:hypothetical protein